MTTAAQDRQTVKDAAELDKVAGRLREFKKTEREWQAAKKLALETDTPLAQLTDGQRAKIRKAVGDLPGLTDRLKKLAGDARKAKPALSRLARNSSFHAGDASTAIQQLEAHADSAESLAKQVKFNAYGSPSLAVQHGASGSWTPAPAPPKPAASVAKVVSGVTPSVSGSTATPSVASPTGSSSGGGTPVSSVDDFMGRISGVESGDPNQTNADSGAHGKYQIMPGNWPSWAREAGVDPADQSGAAQDKVARFKMQQYYQDLGSWDAVAVAWYAGEGAARTWLKNPNASQFNVKQGGGKYPSINEYVQKATGGAGGGAISTNSTYKSPSSLPVEAAMPGADDAGIKSALGWAAALADIPDLKKVWDKAAAAQQRGETWSQETIDAAVKATPWYKARSTAMVNWEVTRRLHPEDAQQQIASTTASIIEQARTTGFTLTPERARTFAVNALKLNMSAPELTRAINAEFHFDPKQLQGTSGTQFEKLKKIASDFLVPVSDAALAKWEESIVKGTDTEDSFTSYIHEQAKSMFPSMSAAIDAGHSVKMYADPYVQVASNELGINPDSINLADPKWMSALMQTDPKTGARSSMNLDQWRSKLRTDPVYGWNKTVNAQNMAADFGQQLLVEMGARR